MISKYFLSISLSFFKIVNFILFTLGLCCCMGAFSSCGNQGLLFIALCGLLLAVVSLVPEHKLWVHELHQLWCLGLIAPPHVESSWTGINPVSPESAGRFLSTAPFVFDFFFKQKDQQNWSRETSTEFLKLKGICKSNKLDLRNYSPKLAVRKAKCL